MQHPKNGLFSGRIGSLPPSRGCRLPRPPSTGGRCDRANSVGPTVGLGAIPESPQRGRERRMSIKVGRVTLRFVKHGNLYLHGDVCAVRKGKGWEATIWDGDCYAVAEAPTLAGAYRAVARAFG